MIGKFTKRSLPDLMLIDKYGHEKEINLQKKSQEKKSATSIYWIRQDLRLRDNPALQAATKASESMIAVYVWAPDEESPWQPGSASKVWLHQSLQSLIAEYQRHDTTVLIFKAGKGSTYESTLQVLDYLQAKTNADSIYWNRCYEPKIVERDKKIKAHFKEKGLEVESFKANLLFEPWEIRTKEDKPFQVFTPYWKNCLKHLDLEPPLRTPSHFPPLPANLADKKIPGSCTIDELDLLPHIKWDTGIREAWTQGEAGAHKQLKKFLNATVGDYAEARNFPAIQGVSRMSPHLHFGEISPRQIYNAVQQLDSSSKEHRHSHQVYLKELGWREFSHHLIFNFPTTDLHPLRKEFEHFPWQKSQKLMHAWQKGLTGYPIVDAGMRELWHTGIMHNSVRMIVASFLVKDLLLSWQAGAKWFWDTLVDADLAQNTMGWHWSAVCGADAAPYFRVFNPTLQGQKFDPQGEYVRQWVPELAKLSTKWIHEPWKAPAEALTASGIKLGSDYPLPIVDHSEARGLALQAFQHLKQYR